MITILAIDDSNDELDSLNIKRLADERTAELNKSHEMLLKLTDQVPGVVYQYRMFSDGRSCFPYASPGINDIYCVTPEEVKEDATPAFRRIHPDDYDRIFSAIMESTRTLELYHNEFRVILPDIGVRWRLCDAKPERMDDGSTLWHGIITDITDRKNAEEALKKTENHYRALIEKAPDGVALIDADSNFLFVSPAGLKMFGYTSDMLGIISGDDLTHPEDLPIVIGELIKVLENPSYTPTLQYRFARVDGSYIWIESTFSNHLANPDINAIVINFRDINERKIAQDLLKESEYFFKETQHAAFIGSYKYDLISNSWTSSEVLNQIFGIDEKYLRTHEGWLDIVHPDDKEMMAQYFVEEVIAKHNSFNKEYRIIRKSDGEIRWTLELGKLNIDENGNVLSIMGTIQDITERKLQDESLSQSNELNQSLLQTIPFGMDIVDEYGNILFISENLSKYFREDVVSKKCWDLYCDNHQQCSNCPLLKGIQLGITDIYESEAILGGKTFQISHTGMMFRGNKAMLEIFEDISVKKEIEKKIKLLAYSLESISECVSITDNNDIIIYVNNSFFTTYGYRPDELIGKHTSILRPADTPFEHVRDILPETIEGGWRGEIMNRKKDGTLFPILLSTSVIKDDHDNSLALIGVATDITDMRRSRLELIAAKEMAEESNRLKSAFLNNMSHEIRTPMNHIMGFSSLMAEAHGEEKDEYAGIILSSSNQLLTLIENVILLSRLQSEKPEVNQQPLEPADIVNNLGDRLRPECLKKNIALKLKIPKDIPPLSILSDHEKIKQILINLTSNAIKYTAEGYVEVGYIVKQDHLTFYVKDTGMGIPLHEQDKIFDSFYRTDLAISKAIGGTGLGLSIVKELVNSLSGTCWLESEVGIGSCFYLSIPMVRTNEGFDIEKSAHSPHRKLGDLSILIVDDEQINFLYLEILLKNSVKKIDHAINGKDALDKVAIQSYSMIFMDLKMPNMNGYDATIKIKQSYPTIPIIAQTAYASIEDREKALQAGCDDFIAKPIKKNALLEVIQKYC
ncbi:MAG: PAS domain S-box protein [Prolixibacteraceae bacterium]|jgi:PAS domain S-box-containing protein|nr:PAS domain S-box protein [Prolixibacteraceae bacterium]